MSGQFRTVQRPYALVATLTVAASLFSLCQMALLGLGQELSTQAGRVLIGEQALEEVLDRAPAFAVTEGEADLYLITQLHCDECRRLEDRAVQLEEHGWSVKLIVVAPRDQALSPLEQTAVAALARTGAGAWSDCGPKGQSFSLIASRDDCGRHIVNDPAEIEGYLEWGRFTLDRAAAVLELNGVTLRAPAALWRDETGWRVTMGSNAALPERAQPGAAVS